MSPLHASLRFRHTIGLDVLLRRISLPCASLLPSRMLFVKKNVVRPSFPMMTITSSMMMMIMSCLVDPVGAEVANESNCGLQHSSTLGAWVCRAG